MRILKAAALILIGVVLVFGDGPAWAGMGVQKAPEKAKAEGVKKAREIRSSHAPVVSPVKNMTHFVKKIEGDTLYTEGGQYSLRGVKVLDLTKNRKVSGLKKMPKKTAQMHFVNGQLREVVIRQR
jgi:hypothetical protein